ncbi:MAG: 16S rRNA (adenine(1518)-N(6)/adenine(1519)-N(6))-dimethyltransferase RsmA [Chloroflexota bacterium]
MRTYGVRAKDQLGQNFLIDREALDSIVQAADIERDDQVLEVGPGIGTLTLAMAETGAGIVAIELDRDMARITAERTATYHKVRVHEGNVLHADLSEVLDGSRPFKVVANIPYYITAPILRVFLEGPHRPSALILMVQKEVGERLAAGPGALSAIALFAQVQAHVDILRQVPATSFVPQPKVDSAVVRLRLRETPLVPRADQQFLYKIVKAGFSAKRKMVHNALNHALPNSGETIDAALRSVGIDRTRRAETLSIAEWQALTRVLRTDHQHTPKDQRL